MRPLTAVSTDVDADGEVPFAAADDDCDCRITNLKLNTRSSSLLSLRMNVGRLDATGGSGS